MQRTVVVAVAEGLHARPAALFVQEAARQPVLVTVARNGADPVSARSILGVMALGAAAGDEVVLATESDDDEAVASIDTLERFLRKVTL